MKNLGNLNGLCQQEDGTYAVTYENLTLTYRFTNPDKLELLAGDIAAHGSWYDLCEDDLKYFGSFVNQEQIINMVLRDIEFEKCKALFKGKISEAGDNIIVLKANGEITVKKNPDEGFVKLKTMYDYIGCNLIEIAPVDDAYFPVENVELIFDEEFLLKKAPVINKEASLLYGYNRHNECLCGTVILMKLKADTDGELQNYGFNNEETKKILHYLSCNMGVANTKFKLHEPKIVFTVW